MPVCSCMFSIVISTDFFKNPKKYQSTLFIARINDWPVDSPFASGCVHMCCTKCALNCDDIQYQ